MVFRDGLDLDTVSCAQITVSYGEGTITDLTYCTINGVNDLMDVYVPSASKPRPLPVMVHVHGGGWVSGHRSTGSGFAELTQTLLDRRYLVVSLDYRLAPTYQVPVADSGREMRHPSPPGKGFTVWPGPEPNRGVGEGSAGGQLVGLLSTADASAGFDGVGGFPGISSRVQAVIAQSAITDFTHPDELRDDYSREFLTWPDPTSPEMIAASPVSYVTADDSPFFFIMGADDTLVLPAQSVRMDQLLRSAGVPSSLLTVQHADHNRQPTTAPIDPSFATIISRMADFFDRYLR
jgi:acetyl esterase/lipase